MNYIKNVLKRISIILLVASILLTIYLVICPVRTLGEVLEKKKLIFSPILMRGKIMKQSVFSQSPGQD